MPNFRRMALRGSILRDISGLALPLWILLMQDFNASMTIDFVMLILAEIVLTAIMIEFLALFLAARSARKADEASVE